MAMYPKIADLSYKDKNLNVKIPIRIKKIITQDLVCEKCKIKESLKTMMGYFLREKQKIYSKGDNIPCPKCNNHFEYKTKELYFIYVSFNKDFINIYNLVKTVIGIRWYQSHKFLGTQIYSILTDLKQTKEVMEDSLSRINNIKNTNYPENYKKKIKLFKLKIYEVNQKQLDESWAEYKNKLIARKI